MPLFWLLLVVLIFVKRAYLYIYLRIICIFIYFSLTPFFSNLLELPLLSKTNNFEKLEKYSYVLVPTAGVYKDFQSNWHPSSNTLMRVSQGEKIAKKLNIPLIISGGNVNNQGVSEASTVGNYIKYNNVFYDHISKNSYETVLNLKKIFNILESKEKILIVTSPKHTLRMLLILDSQSYAASSYIENIDNIINFRSFLPDPRTIHSTNSSLYEYLAILKYIYMKYIKVSIFYD